jgi:hypothetical protein
MTTVITLASFLLLIWGSRPSSPFLFPLPPTSPHPHPTKTTKLTAGVDASTLLYQEQEKLIVQRGELEETLVTNASPLEASIVKVRGTGECASACVLLLDIGNSWQCTGLHLRNSNNQRITSILCSSFVIRQSGWIR